MRRTLLCVIGLSASLRAQTFPKPQEPMVWDQNAVAVIEGESGTAIRLEDRHTGKAREVKPGKDIRNLSYWRGSAWGLFRTEASADKPTITLMRCSDQKRWLPWATLSGHTVSGALYPLDDEKTFFAVSKAKGFIQGNKASYFALFKVNERNELELSELVDLGLKEPLLVVKQPDAKAPSTKIAELNPKYAMLHGVSFHIAPLRFEGGFAIVSQRAGYVWILDGRTGQVKRRIDLISGVKEENLTSKDMLEVAILGIQPRDTGHLLAATRSEDAVLRALKVEGGALSLETLKSPEKMKAYEARRGEALAAFPELLWWDINPDTGEVRRETPPLNVPDKIWDVRILKGFRFRFKPNGDLLVSY
jgi:hypothetical protein